MPYMRRLMNQMPSVPDFTNSPLYPVGIHPPRNIVEMEVEFDESKKVENAEESNTDIPDQADVLLYDIAADSIDNQTVVLVDNEVRILNMRPSTSPESDFTMVQAFLAAGVDEKQLEAALPSRLDLRETIPLWPIKNQGATGACAGFSASSLLEYVFTKTGRLKPGEQIAPRPLWMGAKETDVWQKASSFIEQEGTSLTAVLKILQSDGCVRESFMPFNTLYTRSMQSYYLNAAQLRILSYFNLGKAIEGWKKWLSQYGPIYAAITVDGAWQNATATKGIIESYDSSHIYGGHAVVICGYDSATKRVLFKNSWGKEWGDGGFAWASEAWCNQAVLEAYGVAV